MEDLTQNIEKLLGDLKITDNDIDIIPERIDQVNSALNSFKELRNIITFDLNQSIKTIEKNIARFFELFNSYKETIKKSVEYDLYLKDSNKKIAESNQDIEKNLPKMSRAEKACNTINNILDSFSKSDFLNVFVNDNLKGIENIFKLIHIPKEFDSLSFENNELLLKEFNTLKPRKITEISAGQRAALAISIFLTLNMQLKNGPNILFFDDPITYVDDLNTLSFLDYLRELVIDNEKQIFFATANSNLAYLFKKKFEFLGEDKFKVFNLTL